MACACAVVAAACRAVDLDRRPIVAAVERLAAAADAIGGRVGVAVVDAADGSSVARHAAAQGFLPASNTKLLTAVVALATLGPGHRFATELRRTGEVHDGVLHGDLVLRGFGDPTLGTPASGDPGLRRFVEAVRAAGIRGIDGAVVGDDAWLGDEHRGRGWQWDHLREDFAAPFGALCCGGNVDRGAPVDDPALFAAMELAAALRAAGIEPARAGRAAETGAPEGVLLLRTASPSIEALLPRLLGDSDNLYAEQLWRAAARERVGAGDSEVAEAHGKAVLTALGVGVDGLDWADGSGLSRRNLARPEQVAAALLAAWRSPHREALVAALPLAGVSGTLASRCCGGPAHATVRAKTGSLFRVVALSGYVPRDGAAPPIVFSVLWNDFPGGDDEAPKAAIDAFVQDLAAAIRR